MALDLQALRRPCYIGFRVEVHDKGHKRWNRTLSPSGDMIARDPGRRIDSQSCHDHLTWKKTAGPFISFFTNWHTALRWRQNVINQGATDVLLIAVWLRELPGIYDAYEMARTLRLRDLNWHMDEVLVHGGISADSYRLLAVFHGIRPTEPVAIRIPEVDPRVIKTVEIPGDFTAVVQTRALDDSTATDLLRDEIFAHTGTWDDSKLFSLALSIANKQYSIKPECVEIHMF